MGQHVQGHGQQHVQGHGQQQGHVQPLDIDFELHPDVQRSGKKFISCVSSLEGSAAFATELRRRGGGATVRPAGLDPWIAEHPSVEQYAREFVLAVDAASKLKQEHVEARRNAAAGRKPYPV